MIFFTADTHFGHTNIIKYCNRPFNNVTEMDYIIKQQWNKRVKPEDTVFHLGDFCFKNQNEKNIIQELNGNIIFIKGNHDRKQPCHTVTKSATIYYGKRDIYLVHDPRWANSMMLTLCGHVHEKWKYRNTHKLSSAENKYRMGGTVIYYPIVNVGVDVWDFMPITLDEILYCIKRKSL